MSGETECNLSGGRMTKITIIFPDHIDSYEFHVSMDDTDDPDWGWEESADTLEEILTIIKQKELDNGNINE